MPSMSGKGHNDILSTVVSQLNELKSSTSDEDKPLPSLRLKYHPFYCDKEVRFMIIFLIVDTILVFLLDHYL